jgi:uncharacterized radical SAM superfamily Fe-S cluster-containing enzyme
VLIRDGAVFLRKRCPEHGWHEALISSDADWHLDSLKYNKPGAIPYDFATTVQKGCPDDCGLCPEHQQHTCVGIIEITTRCNLSCPTCFADAGSKLGVRDASYSVRDASYSVRDASYSVRDASYSVRDASYNTGYDLSVVQVEAILDRLLETEGHPEVVQISGGEPTLHPHLLDILAATKARDIRHVMLNTNGLRLAQEPDFVRQLARYRPTVYLQFDGLTASTYQALRGRDLRAIKRQALDHLAEAGLYAVLVATVVQGVNESQIGDILRYGLEHPAVLGVSYQPVTFAGRCLIGVRDASYRITLPDVLHALEAQTEGLFRISDFRPVPCPHPTCSACTYAFVDGEQAGPEPSRRVIPIPRLLDVDDYLDFIANRTLPDLSAGIQPVLESLWSMAAVMGSDKTTDNLACIACGIEVPLTLDPERLREHFFGIQVHGFMDEHTFDLKRLMKCCIHQLLPDGRAVPFCAYNNLGYRPYRVGGVSRRREREQRHYCATGRRYHDRYDH